MNAPSLSHTKLEAFVMRAVNDLSSSYGGVMVSIGNKLGLYKCMAKAGPLSASEVAARSNCTERYVREWLNSQAAGGYLDYHAISDTYELSPEHALVLADENSPVFIPHAWNAAASLWFDEDKTINAFQTGKGVAWGEHDARLHCGVAAFYRNGYRGSLVAQWLPTLNGIVEKLQAGIRVADIGCGHGHSSILMAQAFPKSQFFGYDAHPASIEQAQKNARTADVEGQVSFDIATAVNYPDQQYQLICFFDCLHDMGDPIAAVQYAAKTLAPGGTIMLVEPFAKDHLEENLSPISRLYYAGSTTICCAHAISEGGKMVLGAQAGEARLAEVFRKAGFTHFRRATETPFNLIFEIRR
ncbi:SAM-dependent methyltransferase [Cellvibrio zantedeschiae]|uniref:SAM-dependent methyltransferase n=1 Tax=Cellvibrio zantedeschiae TaxID=1237077 RepID=A0ABQ3B765_9GAMM|nr:methyltransferase domain-containing protein [Cellvibrio zantedeschiae]GGY76827.1 SAM-dependent methyltransferase [Cellvibrio zantedeschiae]